MTRVLVLGGLGMLGHELVRCLFPKFEVWATIRQRAHAWPLPQQIARIIGEIDLARSDIVDPLLERVRPDVVINCVGAIKQKVADDARLRHLNSELPWTLARACGVRSIRLIHFSTDCVFSGSAEPIRPLGYSEEHRPDPLDSYGRSKLEGEVVAERCVTVRTSFIGREIGDGVSLIEWFLGQRGKSVPGYCNALFTGLSTTTMADVVELLLTRFQDLSGLWHVGAKPISKFDLLRLVAERGNLDIDVIPEPEMYCDRRLNSMRFQAATGWHAPSWAQLVDDVLAQPVHRLDHTAH